MQLGKFRLRIFIIGRKALPKEVLIARPIFRSAAVESL